MADDDDAKLAKLHQLMNEMLDSIQVIQVELTECRAIIKQIEAHLDRPTS